MKIKHVASENFGLIVNLLMNTCNVVLFFLMMSSFIINKLRHIYSVKMYINAKVTVQMIHVSQ